MSDVNKYRTNGAIGALLDEYQKALSELNSVIDPLSTLELTKVVDTETSDEDCKSIQTILAHLVQSGYTYSIEIRKWLGEKTEYKNNVVKDNVIDYQSELSNMFEYTEKVFIDYPQLKLTEFEIDKKIIVRWGQTFDVEQLMQHAIVHVLRHRRQIEMFKQKMLHSSLKP